MVFSRASLKIILSLPYPSLSSALLEVKEVPALIFFGAQCGQLLSTKTFSLFQSCLLAQLCLTLLWPYVACQAPMSMEFPRQEYWSGLPIPSPGDLPNSGIEPGSPALADGFFTTEPPGKLFWQKTFLQTQFLGVTWQVSACQVSRVKKQVKFTLESKCSQRWRHSAVQLGSPMVFICSMVHLQCPVEGRKGECGRWSSLCPT